ncbi:MAG: hypothetical protein ACYCVL_03095 [Gemmatimonadaceae bacterium]
MLSLAFAAAPRARAQTPAARDTGSALKTLNVGDYGRWKRITAAGLSPDGVWMTYVYHPNDGDDTLFVKKTWCTRSARRARRPWTA